MVELFKDLKRGDLVELLLKENAVKCIGVHPSFMLDAENKINIPGRYFTGYVVIIESGYIFLSDGWDKIKDRTLDDTGTTQFYTNSIKSYSKK